MEGLDADSVFNAFVDAVNPSTVQYDILDRKTQTTAPDQTVTTFDYGFGTDSYNTTRFKIHITDPNNNESSTYTDGQRLANNHCSFRWMPLLILNTMPWGS